MKSGPDWKLRRIISNLEQLANRIFQSWHTHHDVASSSSSITSSLDSQHIFRMMSPAKADDRWSSLTISLVLFAFSNRPTNLRTDSFRAGARRATPGREKKGSSGFRLTRCISWPLVRKCDSDSLVSIARPRSRKRRASYRPIRYLSEISHICWFVSYFPSHKSHCRTPGQRSKVHQG